MRMMCALFADAVGAIPASKPYYADNLWICALLACTFILSAVLSDRKDYLGNLLRDFFLPRENAIKGMRTTNIVYMRAGMYVVALVSVAILLSSCMSAGVSVAMGGIVGWLLGVAAVASFYLLRKLLLVVTNRIFFEPSTVATWEQSYSNWTILSSVPLYLIAVAAVFFDLSPSVVFMLLAIGLGALEICLLYKAFHIFSAKKYCILQIFVYLCTLELMPLLVVGKALVLFV